MRSIEFTHMTRYDEPDKLTISINPRQPWTR